VKHSAQCRSVFSTSITKLTPFSSYTLVPRFSEGWAAPDKNIGVQVRYGVYRVLEFSWSFVEWSCPSILWCHYLLLPWCYRHENWHMTSSPTDDVIVTSSMTSLFRKFGRWFSSLNPFFMPLAYSTTTTVPKLLHVHSMKSCVS